MSLLVVLDYSTVTDPKSSLVKEDITGLPGPDREERNRVSRLDGV